MTEHVRKENVLNNFRPNSSFSLAEVSVNLPVEEQRPGPARRGGAPALPPARRLRRLRGQRRPLLPRGLTPGK